ncbi:MAG: hypothetical protein E7173_01690 [Firmicutes bacterium]|nr:hypothetical protein [Bacillota bacterium]
MNVIVANKYKDLLSNLDIEVIRRIDGIFPVEEIIKNFETFFFNKMILDITSIQDYRDVKNIQKLSISLDMSKVILLLDNSPETTSPQYLSKLISMGIYNFTTNEEGIMYLYNNPNSYRDVAQYQQFGEVPEGQEIKERVITRYETVEAPRTGPMILGIKNITNHSGATTLTYMMYKQLKKNYVVLPMEVDRRDFVYYNDKQMISVDSDQVSNTINKHQEKDVILIDINNSVQAEAMCHKVICLVEPSIVKLNKLIMTRPNILAELRNKTVVLNISMLDEKDVKDFEYESRINVFFNMPPVDDHKKNGVLDELLRKLGFSKQ